MALRYDSVDTPPNAPVAPAPTTTPVLRRRAKAAGAVATSGHAGRNCRPHPGGSADRQLGAARGVAVPRRPDGTARPGGKLSTLGPQGAARGRGRQPWGPGRTMGVRPRLQHGTTLCPPKWGHGVFGRFWEHLGTFFGPIRHARGAEQMLTSSESIWRTAEQPARASLDLPRRASLPRRSRANTGIRCELHSWAKAEARIARSIYLERNSWI